MRQNDPHDAPDRGLGNPVALYRGPQLRWFRGGTLMALVAASVAMGALLHAGWPAFVAWWFAPPATAPRPVPQTGSDGRVLTASVLTGPNATFILPPTQTTLVNVWLENCSDCMPAFNAWAKFAESDLGAVPQAPSPGLHLRSSVPVVNVAYGQATTAFAINYHVDSSLVFDTGAAVVQQLGINRILSDTT